MRSLDKNAIEMIAKGACFLGSGGGGPLSITPTIIENIFKYTDHIDVINIDEVDDSKSLAIVAGMGSPQRSAGISFDTAPTVAFDAVATAYGELSYVAAIEVGAANSLIPMLVAAQKGIPLIDANGAGRAVPTLPSTTFSQVGIPATPAVLSAVGVPGNPCVTCPSGDSAEEVEAWAGEVLTTDPNFTQYNAGAIALWPFSGKTLKSGSGKSAAAIGGSLVLAEKIGVALESKTPVESVQKVLIDSNQAHHFLGIGKVIAVKEEAVGALDGGIVVIDMGKHIIELPYLNEFLGAFVWDSQTPSYVLGPDMICCMTPAGEPLSNPSINELFNTSGAFDIAVFTLTAADAMKKPSMYSEFANNISKLYPAFKGSYGQPGTLTMAWTNG
tara:strand:+ start:127 stop:1284 length:1158 start_codon:yes stop_codon:yes gene_type:complete